MEDLSLAFAHSPDELGLSREKCDSTGNWMCAAVDLFRAAVEADAALVAGVAARVPESELVGFVESARVYRVNTLRAASGILHFGVRSSQGSVASSPSRADSAGSGDLSSGSSGPQVGSAAFRGLLRARALGAQTALAKLPNGLCYLKGVVAGSAIPALDSVGKFPSVAKLLSRPREYYHDVSALNTLRLVGKGSCKHVVSGTNGGVPYGDALLSASAGRDWPVGSLGAWFVAKFPGRPRSSGAEVAVRVGGVVPGGGWKGESGKPDVVAYPSLADPSPGVKPAVYLGGQADGVGFGWRGRVVAELRSEVLVYSSVPVPGGKDFGQAGVDVRGESRASLKFDWASQRIGVSSLAGVVFPGSVEDVSALLCLTQVVSAGVPVVVMCAKSSGWYATVKAVVAGRGVLSTSFDGFVGTLAAAARRVVGGGVPLPGVVMGDDPWMELVRSSVGASAVGGQLQVCGSSDGLSLTRVAVEEVAVVLVSRDSDGKVVGFVPVPEEVGDMALKGYLASMCADGGCYCWYSLSGVGVVCGGDKLDYRGRTGEKVTGADLCRAQLSYGAFCSMLS